MNKAKEKAIHMALDGLWAVVVNWDEWEFAKQAEEIGFPFKESFDEVVIKMALFLKGEKLV